MFDVCLSGSTWLKAICLFIVERNNEDYDLLIKDNRHFNISIIETKDFMIQSWT